MDVESDADSVDNGVEEAFDEEFCQLYYNALASLLSHNGNCDLYKPFRRYLNLLRSETNSWCEFYHRSSASNDMSLMLTDTLFYRLAYVYRNSTLLSSAVAFHLENVLNECPEFLEKLLQKRQIKICSLGSGPASDVVAIVHVLDAISRARGFDLEILVTVIDIESHWKNTCYGVLSNLERFRDAMTKVKFLQADLAKFYTDETLEAVQNADIISAVKFFSEFLGTHKDLQRMMKMLEEIIQPGSLLFFLDRPQKKLIKPLGDHIGKLKNFNLIYEEVHDLHGLSVAAVERNYHLYSKVLGPNVFNTCVKVLVRAWLKKSNPPVIYLENDNRFISRRQKFDGKQFLATQYFEYEKLFYEKMLKIGWDEKGLDIYLSLQRKMIFDMDQDLDELIDSAESARENARMEHYRTGSISVVNWQTYFRSKMDLSLLKRSIYCELVINIRGSLKNAL